MALDVVLTGTGTPTPNSQRAGAGVLVRYKDITLQFDAGRATTMRLRDLDLHPVDLSALFVTHHHSDHMLGIPDLVMSRWIGARPGRGGPLPVVAPLGGSSRFIEKMLVPWEEDIKVRQEHSGRKTNPEVELEAFEVKPGRQLVWSSGSLQVYAHQVHHEPVMPSVAYRVETPDGSVVVSGDTKVCEEMAELSTGADVVVHEVCRADLLRDGPGLVGYHSDSKELGVLATRVRMPTLMLYHLVPAPADEAAEDGFREDVRRSGFKGDLVVGRDLSRVTI
jgi:ribonuclease Z